MIVLATLNARYFHASLGLRYLYANMGELQNQTRIEEFIITDRPQDVAEKLLALNPSIIGLGVYVWNARESLELAALLKQVAPHIQLVVGGPEVSYETESQPIFQWADHVIKGPGDLGFAALCRDLQAGRSNPKIIEATPPSLQQLTLPYSAYSEEDISRRILYVEASRGCPFRCEFCLSSLDKTASPFELERFLAEMDQLYLRGARQFKFVDRTFNLNVKASLRILEFFLERLDEKLFLHFEVIPDRLPEELKAALRRFPAGSLQLEVGVQTFNPEVQTLISRRQDNEQTCANLRWLRHHTQAHIHADLIIGLPGEDLASVAAGFDRMIELDPHEIQVGLLKRLRGAPISRHETGYALKFNPVPPYTIVQTAHLDFATLQRLTRFARYWDLVGNSGRFHRGRKLLLAEQPFYCFLDFSDWLFQTTKQTHQIGQDRLFDLVYQYLTEHRGLERAIVAESLAEDFWAGQTRSIPKFMEVDQVLRKPNASRHNRGAARQERHLS